ncbi:hypothetical protein Tco_0332142 [Tanacetum coccineum]
MQEVILFYKGLDVPTRQILDSKRGEEGNTLEEAYYTQFGEPFPNARRYRAAALKADVPSIRRIKPNRYAVSSQQKDDKIQLIKLHRASVPFHGHLKEYGYDEKEVLKGLKKVQVYSAESSTSLKRLLKEKTRI